MGILNDTFKLSFVQKFSSIKVYNALVLPILLHKSEIRTLRKKDKKRLTSTEMTFFRTVAGQHPS
jgi:hypothetical protein